MKRCPQCEFIYEDDQSLCDMDGVLLVFDSRTLPNLHALATVSAPVPEKGPRRSRMVPAFATLLLTLAIASVYYVSSVRNSAQNDFSPATVNNSTTDAPAVVPPAPADDPNQAHVPAAEPSPETTEEATKEQPRETHASPAVTKPAAPPARKSTTAKPTKAEPKKDDSKVESILKKTGKILKKPFKF